MRNVYFLLLPALLLVSCDKIDEHYTYEGIVPGTNILESQLGTQLTWKEFQEATKGVRYEYVRPYPCIEDNGKVFYSLSEENLYSGPYTRQIQFEGDSLRYYTFTPGYMDVVVTVDAYVFNVESQALYKIEHPRVEGNVKDKVIFVNGDYLIFETNGSAQTPWYYTDNADFCRVVYKAVDKSQFI